MRHGRHNSGVPAPIDLASVSDVQPFPEDDAARMAADPANASRARSRRAAVRGASSPQRSPVWQALGICAELLITAAVICALYIVWQMWWTGVEAERAQNETTQSVDWSDPSNNGGTVTIAKAQEGDAPVQPKDAKYGDLIARIGGECLVGRRCRCADDYGSAGAVQFGGHLFRQRAVVAR